MKPYYVVTPEYEVTMQILDFGEGPKEPCRDVVEVEANTKREAKIKGLKELRKIQRGWINWYRDTDTNPFTGLRVEEKEL